MAVKEQELIPVAPPEIEDVQLKNETLLFKAKIDVVPEVKIKSYRGLKVIKKKIKLEQDQVDQALDRLRQQKKPVPELNEQFAQGLGFKTVQELQEAVRKDLQANAQMQVQRDTESQLIQQLLQRTSLDIPESLVNNQTEEALRQLKINAILRGEKKEQVEAKESQLREQAKNEAIQRVRLSFVLDKIAELESVQVEENELQVRIAEISQRLGKSEDETRAYLDKENLMPGLEAELKNRKTIQLLLTEANVVEEK
ncbi:MAG: hypothetical protein HQ595_01285 [Candidatus Omnitrophica bacterium]|nr:hypothetical protein [Candidatus Omnitrophota bacterium]